SAAIVRYPVRGAAVFVTAILEMESDRRSDAATNAPVTREQRFRAIFDAEVSYVHHSLRRLGIAPPELDDAAQEVFVTLFRRFDDYDASRPIRHWLFGIALRVASTRRRRAPGRREVAQDVPTELSDPAPLADNVLAEEQSRRLVLSALDAIGEERRPVFVM